MNGLRFESEKEEDTWLRVVEAALGVAKTFPDGGITKVADQVILAMRDRQPVERKPYAKPFPKFTSKPADKPAEGRDMSTDTK